MIIVRICLAQTASRDHWLLVKTNLLNKYAANVGVIMSLSPSFSFFCWSDEINNLFPAERNVFKSCSDLSVCSWPEPRSANHQPGREEGEEIDGDAEIERECGHLKPKITAEIRLRRQPENYPDLLHQHSWLSTIREQTFTQRD